MRKDRYNGGFLKGSLIERQLGLGQNLIVCFIDFSRAFDLMNRDIFLQAHQVGIAWKGN